MLAAGAFDRAYARCCYGTYEKQKQCCRLRIRAALLYTRKVDNAYAQFYLAINANHAYAWCWACANHVYTWC